MATRRQTDRLSLTLPEAGRPSALQVGVLILAIIGILAAGQILAAEHGQNAARATEANHLLIELEITGAVEPVAKPALSNRTTPLADLVRIRPKTGCGACRSGSNLAPLSSGEYLIEHYGPGCREEPATNEVGWYCFNSQEQLKPVGLKPANAWGLLDMHGNAGEWTWDWYHPAYYGLGNSYLDPLGPDRPSVAEARVVRSGTYYTGAPIVRCGARGYGQPTGSARGGGFRPARTLPTTQ